MIRKFPLILGTLLITMSISICSHADTLVNSISDAPSTDNAQGISDNPNEVTSYIIPNGPGGNKSYTENGILVIGGASTGTVITNATGDKLGTETINNVVSNTNGPGAEGSANGNGNINTQTGNAATAPLNIDESIKKPDIKSEAAVLIDSASGEVLFTKDGDKQMRPASLTKLMTGLLAVEKLDMEDSITYSASATENLESGATTVGTKKGDIRTVKDSLYATMLKSACETANGLAEKVSGSIGDFSLLMNERAKELGCKDTDFKNPSGLNAEGHHSTAIDLALIMRAALNNDKLCTIMSTAKYELAATKGSKAQTITNGNKLLKGAAYYMDGIIAGKTGYTSKAGNCLASGADILGRRLIAVVLKSNGEHYNDTKALYEYGRKIIESNKTAENNVKGDATDNTATVNNGTTESADGEAKSGNIIISAKTDDDGAHKSNKETDANDSMKPQVANKGGWEGTVNTGYKYLKKDGSYCKNEWLNIDNKTYYFEDSCKCAKGWKLIGNDRYYFNPDDWAMVKNKWIIQAGKSYYLGPDGKLMTNTVIDGIYEVDENGVYVGKVS